jgi:PAS domain S-box-containing protein
MNQPPASGREHDTDRRSVRNAEERFQLLLEAVTDYAIFLLDPNGYVLTWNSGAHRIKGYQPDEIIGQHFSRFYPPEAVQAGWPDHELRVAAEQGRFEDEGWRVRKDGSRFWANVVITALPHEDGRPRGFAKVTRDLTQRRQQEEALRRSEEHFRLLVEGVTDYAIFMLDPNGYVLTWNFGAQRIKGYQADEIIGQHFTRFYPPAAVQAGWPEHELHVAAEQGRFEDEGWRVRKDGSQFWANVVISALHDDSGRLRGFAKLTRDLSERERAEALHLKGSQRDEMLDAERNARIEAQHAARMKDEFLATLSHELRTPLSAILGWAQLLRKPGSGNADNLQRGVEAIERNARAQVGLIDELLDLSRIMAGRIRLDVQRVMLSDVIRGAVESAQPTAQSKGVRLETILDPLAGSVSGDPARLQQVMWNLLSNAIKFTPKRGRVQVLLERVNSHLEVTVSDTGIGIPPDFLPYVFDRFSQKDTSTARRYGGLGLGLAIAKQLIELHGGRLYAKSAGEGRGASFIINLPLTILSADAEDPHRFHPTPASGPEALTLLPRLDGVRVLAVDDEPDARDLMQRVLAEHGATVITAGSGEEALRILETVPFDVLLSDIGMPGIDGYQLMRRIRATERKEQHLPALALTAFARPEDRKKVILSGYQSHLAKPFDLAELVIVIAGLVGRTADL